MGLVAVYFLAWPIWRAQFPLEIWFTEGWNAYLQDAAGTFNKLYPAADQLTGNNYPPLSFYTIGLLARLTGLDSLYVGRAVSIIGLFGVAVDIFICARILTRSTIGPLFGALWYLAIMSHNATAYVGANDPQIAGEAIMGAALALFLALDAVGRPVVPALILMVLAGFWKHNMIAVPLAAVTWILWRDRSRAIPQIIASVGAIFAGLGICGLLFGHEFYSDLLATRAYGLGNVLTNVGHLQWYALAAVIWAMWALVDLKSKVAQFTALHIVLGFGACILQWFGDGVSGNAEFDLILALGLGTGVTFARIEFSLFAGYIRANYLRDAMVIMLLLRLVVTGRQEPALMMFQPDFRTHFEIGSRQVARDASAISAIPGDVYCSNDVVCRIAGKRFIVDDFKVEEMVKTGQFKSDQLSNLFKARDITVFRNDAGTFALAETSIVGKRM